MRTISFLGEGEPASITAIGPASGQATPGAATSILYKFGMSPMLWLIAAGAIGGSIYLFHRRKVKR